MATNLGEQEHRDLAQGVGMLSAMDRAISVHDTQFPKINPRYWAIVNFGLALFSPATVSFQSTSGDSQLTSLCTWQRFGPEPHGHR